MSKKNRIQACKLAAIVMAGRTDTPFCPEAWSLAVFFEQYITKGARRTARDFGPKEPVRLKEAKA